MGIVLCLIFSISCCRAQSWYEELWPGITRTEVLKIAGRPTLSTFSKDVFEQPKGKIECTYDGLNLVRATFLNGPDGEESANYFVLEKGVGTLNRDERVKYLKNGNFVDLPNFTGPFIYSNKYGGRCFKIDDGYLVVQPILGLLGSGGYFLNKAAIVLWIGPSDKETVLYRAIDHWDRLRPPDISQNDVKRRVSRLLAAGKKCIGMKTGDLFGPSNGAKRSYSIQNAPFCPGMTDFPEPEYARQTVQLCNFFQCDAFGGSGIFREYFYLDDGLAVVLPDGKDNASKISIVRPGRSVFLTLDEWMTDRKNLAPK